MWNKREIITVIILVSMNLTLIALAAAGVFDDPYVHIEDNVVSLLKSAEFKNVKVYDASEITLDLLENREGKTIVERCYGVVLDMETGDGRIINAADGAGNYISYRSVYQTHDENSIMLTYLVYNPENNYCDDIIIRYDFVLEK